MADQVITKQELIDAQKDAQTLEDAVNGEPGKLIKSRTGREFYSLASVPQINTMTREEVTAAVAPKANDAEVYKKTETFTRAETNALVAPKANQADVDSAISGMNSTLNTSLANLSTDANKFYPTLAEANAAIALIAVNQPVTIGEVANGGLWYKATAGATSLTKSPYDTLQQSKNYTNANPLFNPVLITSGMFSNVDNIKTSGLYICDNNTVAAEISGLPTVGRGFVLAVISKGNLTRQEISHIGENFEYTRTSLITGVFPAFGRLALKSDTDALVASSVAVLKDSLIYEYSLNMFNPANAVDGWRIGGTGQLNAVTGAKHSGFIPVAPGEKYTISWSNAVSDIPYYSLFTNKTDTVPVAFNLTSPTTSPLTITIPANANFIVVNLKHSSSASERTNFQIELGSTATTYKPWASLGFKLRDNVISNNIMRVSQFSALQDANPKSYEKVTQSVNLFDESKIQNDKFLSTVNGGISAGAGWKISGFIPVVAGQTYTLSGTRARQGVSFFPTNAITTEAALLYDNTSVLPLTVTAPAGANYAVIALESATAKGWTELQFEVGTTPTPYIPYGQASTKVLASHIEGIEDLIPKSSAKASYKLTYGTGTIKCGLLELGIKVFNPVTYLGNPVFNFNNDKYNGKTIRLNGDDVAPVRMMGATIGANHGYSRSNLTLAAHGKTVADVGSVWSDGTNEWVIVQINSGRIDQGNFISRYRGNCIGATQVDIFIMIG